MQIGFARSAEITPSPVSLPTANNVSTEGFFDGFRMMKAIIRQTMQSGTRIHNKRSVQVF